MNILIFVVTLAFGAPTITPSSDIPEKRKFELNKDIGACQNFHQYVCSNAEKSFKLRDDRSLHTFSFSDSRERILEAKKKFMKELPKQKDIPPRTAQIRDFYLACMNTKEKIKEEKKFVGDLVSQFAKIKTSDELQSYIFQKTRDGLNPLFRIGPATNPDNPKKIETRLMSNLMILADQEYYEKPEVMKEFENVLTVFFQNIYPNNKKSVNLKKAQEVILLQKEFIKTYPTRAVRRQRWSEKRILTQADILKQFPNLKLQEIFRQIPDGLLVNLPVPESFTFINADLGTRPLYTWKDLLLYLSASEKMDDAYPKYFQTEFDFEKKFFGGAQTRSDRQERCTTQATEYFMKELDAALVDQLFPQFDESQMIEVGSRIRQSILQGLKDNKWLSREGKKEAIAKITKARLQLVKPHNEREWDFTPLKEYSKTKYIQNLITYSQAAWDKDVQEMKEPANQDSWGMGPLVVNAYYSSNENKFVMPIGILQYPFFDKDGSIIENLGAVGAVVGHELGHSIDDGGSKFDSEGRLRQWMTTKDLMEFNLRSQKMIDQFNNAQHNGKLTLGENVADLVGLTFAYNAAFPKNEGTTEDKQKFFVAYARTWCGVVRPDFAQMLLKTDSHAAGWARINEQVKHQPHFAKAFQCKVGDPMTLPEKDQVKIW